MTIVMFLVQTIFFDCLLGDLVTTKSLCPKDVYNKVLGVSCFVLSYTLSINVFGKDHICICYASF